MTFKKILPRRGTAAAWATADPILELGELGFETDTGFSKRGDGAALWSALEYDHIVAANQLESALSVTFENIVGNYEPESLALFARMEVRPPTWLRTAMDILLSTLKEHDLWDRLDGFYMFAAHTEQAALLNWRRDAANMVAVNSPTFTDIRGFACDGTSSYLWNTNAAITEMQPTDASVSLWLKTKKTSGSFDLSLSGWDARISTSTDIVVWRLCQGASNNFAITDATMPGLYTIARDGANDERIYKDGTLEGSPNTAYASGAAYTTTNPIYVGTTNASTGFTNGSYSFMSYGASMDSDEAALFYNAVYTYMFAVGLVT